MNQRTASGRIRRARGAGLVAAALAGLVTSAPAGTSRNLRRYMALGAGYYKRGNFPQAYRVWEFVSKRLTEKGYHRKPKARPFLAKVRYLMGRAKYRSRRFQAAARHWREALALEAGQGPATKGLRHLVRIGRIGPEEVAPMPGFPRDPSARAEKPPPPKPVVTPVGCPPGETGCCDPGGAGCADEAGTGGAELVDRAEDVLAKVPVRPDPARAADAWREAKRRLRAGEPAAAVSRLVDAYRFGRRRPEVDFKLAEAFLLSERPARALVHLQEVLEAGEEDEAYIRRRMGQAHGLLGDVPAEIRCYLRVVELDPDDAEAQFLLALAYDKAENTSATLRHAQLTLRIDPSYKARLKARIKDSFVAQQLSRIVASVLKDSKYDRLSDEAIDEYVEQISRILGEENIHDPTGTRRQDIREAFHRARDGEGLDRALIDKLPRDQRAAALRALRKDPAARRIRDQVRRAIRAR